VIRAHRGNPWETLLSFARAGGYCIPCERSSPIDIARSASHIMRLKLVPSGLAIAMAAGAASRCVAQAFVGQDFAGGAGATIALQPPDTDGAAGVDHYVQFINGRFAIYNKGTGALISSQTSFQFWTGAGITFGND